MQSLRLPEENANSINFIFKEIDYVDMFFNQHSEVSIYLKININGCCLVSFLQDGKISIFFEEGNCKESFFVFKTQGVMDVVNFSEFDLYFEDGIFPFQNKKYNLKDKNIKYLYLLMFEWYGGKYFYYVI
jgi:hypothetical protein